MRDIHLDIQNLKNEILQTENKISEFMKTEQENEIKSTIQHLESNLKYLSILANGAPIDKNEDRKIMDFLRIHYEYLQKLSLPV
jgi:hypothetical protein